MSEQVTTTPAPTAEEAGAEKSTKRPRFAIAQGLANELSLAAEIAGTIAKADYAAALAEEGIDAVFIEGFRAKIVATNKLVSEAGGAKSNKTTSTEKEAKRKQELENQILAIQTRAKRKFMKPGDPQRAKYYIGEQIGRSRPQLVAVTNSILETLTKEALPGVTPARVTALREALAAYEAVQTEQTTEQSKASGARDKHRDKFVRVMDNGSRQAHHSAAAVRLGPSGGCLASLGRGCRRGRRRGRSGRPRLRAF